MLRDLCGLQAQVLSAAWLGVRARSAGMVAEDLDRALARDRSIVRSWLMRGTLHAVAAEDLGWLIQLLGPLFARAQARRQAQLGLNQDVKTRGVKAIRRILAEHGPLTRYELVDRLRPAGVRLDPRSQAPIHLIQLAALEGVLCLGPDNHKSEPTYILIEDWLGGRPPAATKSAPAELARRYFRAYGPATADDLSAWSGLPVGQARLAVAEARPSLAQLTLGGEPAFLLKGGLDQLMATPHPAADVRLLPAFDTYLLGYSRRDRAVPASLQGRLQRGGGWIHPAVAVDGRVVGTWSLGKVAGRAELAIETLKPIKGPLQEAVEAEVVDIGRFLNTKVTLLSGRSARHSAASLTVV